MSLSFPAVLLASSAIFAVIAIHSARGVRRLQRENDEREGDPDWRFALPRFRQMEREYRRDARVQFVFAVALAVVFAALYALDG